MSEVVFPPLLVKSLGEKLYDKRKTAALEIEKMVKDNISNPNKIKSIISTLVNDFTYSNLANSRNGGLISLAAVAIALGSANLTKEYLDLLIPPILSCFTDLDSKVRYYACESMYNVAKVSRTDCLKYFNEIFDNLGKLAGDIEISVKNGAELLDRLIKDIVIDNAKYFPPERVTGNNSPYISQNPQLTLQALQPTVIPSQPTQQIGDFISTNTEYSNEAKLKTNSTLPLPHNDMNIIVPGTTPLLTAISPPSTFNLPRFIPLLQERIKTVNTHSRMFFVQWIAVLANVPDLELLSYLPDFLDGLFIYLSDPNSDVRVATLNVLGEFLKDIIDVVHVQNNRIPIEQNSALPETSLFSSVEHQSKITEVRSKPSILTAFEYPPTTSTALITNTENKLASPIPPTKTKTTLPLPINQSTPYKQGQGVLVDFSRMTNIISPYLLSPDEETQSTALKWINEFILASTYKMLPFTSTILSSVLPCLSSPNATIKACAITTNDSLFDLVKKYDTSIGEGGLFDLTSTVETLTFQFQDEREEARNACIEWLLMLHKKAPNMTITTNDSTFSALIRTLSDNSEEVVKRDLQLLSQISSSASDENFRLFLKQLLALFQHDRRLLENRGSLIIRHICVSMDPERIYRFFAMILIGEARFVDDLEFVGLMIQNLNIILMTAPELVEVRRKLRNLDSKEGIQLFTTLYRSWSHNSISTFTLCLLSQSYEHASNLLQLIGMELEITVSFLIQVDKLVQLIESPVFTYLRLSLLEPEKNPYLLKCMYGILMLLPQSSAFATLRNRLNSVSGVVEFFNNQELSRKALSSKKTVSASSSSSNISDNIKWNELLNHFRNIQTCHEIHRHTGVTPKRGDTTTSLVAEPTKLERKASVKSNSKKRGSGSWRK